MSDTRSNRNDSPISQDSETMKLKPIEEPKSTHERWLNRWWVKNEEEENKKVTAQLKKAKRNKKKSEKYKMISCPGCKKGDGPCMFEEMKEDIKKEAEKLVEKKSIVMPKNLRFHCYAYAIAVIYGHLGFRERRQLPRCVDIGIKTMWPEQVWPFYYSWYKGTVVSVEDLMDGDNDDGTPVAAGTKTTGLFAEEESDGTMSTSDGSIGTMETVVETLSPQEVPVPVPDPVLQKCTMDDSEYEYSTEDDERDTATYVCVLDGCQRYVQAPQCLIKKRKL
jgi:hypothetical protein